MADEITNIAGIEIPSKDPLFRAAWAFMLYSGSPARSQVPLPCSVRNVPVVIPNTGRFTSGA